MPVFAQYLPANGFFEMLRQCAFASVDRNGPLKGLFPLGPLPPTALLLLICP